MAQEKKTGMSLPSGILQPTTQPETVAPVKPAVTAAAPAPVEQGGDPADDGAGAKPARTRKRKASVAASEKVADMKIYLTEDVRFRLRMLAFKRNAKISTVANEVLDKALPRWSLERTE